MRTALLGTFALSLAAGAALAQTTSTPGGPSTSTPGGPAASGATTSRGAPALVPTPKGPITPSRSSTDVFPPSRLLPPTQGTTTQTTQTPGGSITNGTPGSTTNTGTPGGTPTDTPTDPSTNQNNTTSAQTNTTTPATTPDGQPAGDGTTGPTRPIPPNSQTSSGGGPAQTRTGKNPSNETVADCMRIWEPSTHMTKAEWSRTCRRVQGRLDQVTRQTLEQTDKKILPK